VPQAIELFEQKGENSRTGGLLAGPISLTGAPQLQRPDFWRELNPAAQSSATPLMKANLSIYPITATETPLVFKGLYEPPLGPLGKALNAMVGFLSDVAEYLRKTLR